MLLYIYKNFKVMKDKIIEQILKEKSKDRPNYKAIQKLQQLLDEPKKISD